MTFSLRRLARRLTVAGGVAPVPMETLIRELKQEMRPDRHVIEVSAERFAELKEDT